VVLMVPVAKEADFLGLLRTYLQLDPKKLKENLYSFPIPKIPAGPGYLRFAHGYAYVTIRSAESIDPERLITPKDFFAEKQTDILNAKVHIDRFPADIRRSILGQLELGWHESLAAKGGCEWCRQAWAAIVDWQAGTTKRLLEDGKRVELAVRIDPKAGVSSLHMELEPRNGSPLAKYLSDAGCGSRYVVDVPLDARTLQRILKR
jgi:hypothetical protein